MQFGDKDDRINNRRMIWHYQIALVLPKSNISRTFDLISARQKPSPHAQQNILAGIKYPCHYDKGQGYEEVRHNSA
jgi:hypothetical protein